MRRGASTARRRHPVRAAGLAAGLLLGLALPTGADEHYPATSFFAAGLTPDSSWDEIRSAPGIRPDFPFLPFGGTYAPITTVCVERGMARIADPKLDNGMHVAVERLPGRLDASAAGAGRARAGSDGHAVVPAAASAGPAAADAAAVRYGVLVYRLLPAANGAVHHVYLFEKTWQLSPCPHA